MEDENESTFATGRSLKRKRVATELPRMVEMTVAKWRCHNRLHDTRPAGVARKVEAIHDPDSFMILPMLNRACRRYTVLSPGHYSHNEYYVGLDGSDFAPVHLRAGDRNDTVDDYGGAMFALGGSRRTGYFVIPPCDMLRSNQMTFLKRLAVVKKRALSPDDRDEFRQISQDDFTTYRTESTESFQKGRVCSVLVNNASAQPDYAMLPSTAPDSWTGFRMRMPRLANISIPQDLTNEISGFLQKYNKDLIELTFAMSMALVWARLSLAPGHQPELCTIKPGTNPSEGQAKKTVPLPSLAVFLLYSPHFFRLHEENSLAVYGHVFRFVSSTYTRDSAYNEAFRISADDINERNILEMFSNLNLEDEDWMEIVPPSFEGSMLPMPMNRGCRAPRSESTTATLMLPDIHSIGLPDYRNDMKKNSGLVIRDLVVHKTWTTPPVVNERSWAQNYSGPAYFTNNALKRYTADGSPQLWSAPKTAIRAPWRDGVRSTYNSSTGQLRTPSTTPTPNQVHEQRLKQEFVQPEQPLSPEVPEQSVVEFSKQLVAQFRIAQEKGFITPNVRLGDTGLVWDGIENEIESSKTLHPAISISQLVAADAAAQANLLTQRDKVILQWLLKDLENSNNVPRCMMSFKLAIDTLDDHTTKSRIAELIQDIGQSLETAMNRVAQYGQEYQQGEAAFIRHIIKPCCVLLDIDYPGTVGEGHRAIIQGDLDVGMAISNITYLGMLPNTGSLQDAVRMLQHSNKFASIWRFLLFKDRLMGANFDDRRKELWAKVFREPYDSDEERARRKCDGYTSPPKGAYSWDELLQGNISDVALGQSALTSGTTAEKRAISFFQRVAAPALGGSLNKHFWITVVPQVANQEPVAKHAMMAVSSLYENFTKRSRLDIASGADDQSSAFAVWHYNEAIRLLRTTTDRALILFVCVLFICIELLRKNSKDAVEHCRHGINILNEVRSESDFIKNHVQPAIRNLSIVPYLYGADPNSFPTLGKPAPATKYNFRNISEAHQSLVCVLVRVVRFARCLSEPRLEPGRNGPDPGTEWTEQGIVEDMDAWLEGLRHFTGYIYVPAGPEERDICRLLEMRWVVGKVMLLTCRSKNEHAYDEHIDKFRTIVELAIPAAAAATASAGKRKPGHGTERHPLELGFTSLLAFVVMKCRVFELRLAAWKLMNKLHRPNDNIWSEDVTIVLGRRIMELEHHVNLDDMKLDDDDDISELGEGDPALVQKERIVNFSANFANTEFPRRNVRFNFLLKEGHSKEYVVEDDWISVKSRPKTQLLEEESEWTWKGHC
ncbi:hypothetical protein CcaCcLH18_08361 [Colletotrichum camelliae]|nr:hypothetical protein CcaCcLH18_08361 [Colletotrichum camelliae]